MTILGQHTIDETRQLIRTVEFRIDRTTQTLLTHLEFNAENVALVNDWNAFVDERWKAAHDKAIASMLNSKILNPLVSESIMPAEKEFQIISTAINAKPGVISPGDLSDLINRLEKASGLTLDETGHPMPPDFDPDLGAFQRADAAIKAGEGAAKAFEASLPGIGTPSIGLNLPWYGYAIGAAIAGAVGYSVYKTSVQVKEKAERDTKYINENLTSKALPGYKG